MQLRDLIRRLPVMAVCAAMLAAPLAAQTPEPAEIAFRKEVTAVLGPNGVDGVLLVAAEGSRRLKVGETWRDGWVLQSMTAGSATLHKGREDKLIDLSKWPGETAAAGSTGDITLTNAQAGGSRPARPDVQALLLEIAGFSANEAVNARAEAELNRLRARSAVGSEPPETQMVIRALNELRNRNDPGLGAILDAIEAGGPGSLTIDPNGGDNVLITRNDADVRVVVGAGVITPPAPISVPRP